MGFHGRSIHKEPLLCYDLSSGKAIQLRHLQSVIFYSPSFPSRSLTHSVTSFFQVWLVLSLCSRSLFRLSPIYARSFLCVGCDFPSCCSIEWIYRSEARDPHSELSSFSSLVLAVSLENGCIDSRSVEN